MSTNFYWEPKNSLKSIVRFFQNAALQGEPSEEDTCLHIGKRSVGWVFSFQAHKIEPEMAKELGLEEGFELNSWKNWQLFFEKAGGQIRDEYYVEYSPKQFKELVDELSPGKLFRNGKELLNHYDEIAKAGLLNEETDFKDQEGFSFSSREFF